MLLGALDLMRWAPAAQFMDGTERPGLPVYSSLAKLCSVYFLCVLFLLHDLLRKFIVLLPTAKITFGHSPIIAQKFAFSDLDSLFVPEAALCIPGATPKR